MAIDKKILEELKQKLEKEKTSVKGELEKFAEKDKTLSGDWDARFPKFDSGKLEEKADEVEEFSTLLSLENNLELRLKDIEEALEKIGKSGYGKCEKCGKEIAEERLQIYPAARFCMECEK